jgi:tetratricopeptide (TPR) repeat protein
MRAFYPKWITRCFLVAVLIVFTTIGTLGQNAILDSLRNSIKTAKEDSVRVKSLYKLSDLYREKNLDSALLFAKKADSISEKSRSILSQINTLSMLGTIYTLRGQYDQALEYLLRSVKQAEKLGDTIKLIKAYSALGELYGYSFKNFEKAIYYGNITIKFSEQIKDTPLLVMQLNNLSNFYFNSRNYDRPLAIARQQLDIARQQKDTGSIATTLCSIGDVYREKKNYDTCIIYYNEGTGLLKHLAEKDSSYYPILAMMYGNSSIPYVILKKYPEAIEIINSEIRIFKKTGFKRNVIDGYHRLVTVYMATNEWGKAKEFNAYCLEYFSKTHLTIDFNAELKRNAEICTHLGDYKTAYEQLDSFIDIQSSLQNT